MALDFEASMDLRDRLLLLYIIYKAENPITYAELEALLLKTELIDYIKIAEALEALIEAHFVDVLEGEDFTLLMLSEQGRKSLLSLEGKINSYHRDIIDREIEGYLKNKEQKFFSSASYTKVGENATLVNMRINEDYRELFNMTIRVNSNEEAERMVGAWEKNSIAIFHTIVSMFDIK